MTILDGIGSTEALHIFISNTLEDYKPGSTGKIVPGYDARIEDENGDEVAAGDSGQLMIRGNSTARYYWNNPEKTAQTMVGDWLNTGDTYIKDEDGYFHYCGRNDDMLKVGGIWCSPFEIEAKLVEHPKVLEAAIVGRADADTLIKPEAYVVLNDTADAGDDTAEELLQHCKQGSGEIQISALVQLRRRIAKDRDRQDPTVQAALVGRRMRDKRTSLPDAIGELVRDGDSVVLGACLEPNIPFAATYEIIRQGKAELRMIAPISDGSTDMLIGAGCVDGIIGAWVGSVSAGLGHNYRRAAESGIPNKLDIEDHSNFTLGMALLAGAYGMPYAPTRSVLGSDIVKSNPKLRLSENPLSDNKETIVLVPPLKPDVAILCVQRADSAGNAHHWGNAGVAKEAAIAADRVILLADEIVPAEVITSDPGRVLFPGLHVSAVCHVEAGCHPAPMTGRWRRDHAFFDDYHRRSRDADGYREWAREWIHDLPDHAAYKTKLGQRLEDLRIRGEALSAPTNWAAA